MAGMASEVRQYLAWRRSPSVGCMFARFLSRRPTDHGQRVGVVKGASPTAIAAEIAGRVTDEVKNTAVVASALVIPAVKNLSTLVEVTLALAREPMWQVSRRTLAGTPAGDMVAFGITRTVLLGDGSPCPSEALVMGPFQEFPETRRAPVVALDVFVGTPPPLDPKNAPTAKANLADMKIHLPSEEAFRKMWHGSISGRLKSLGGVIDERAKAKVSFVIPIALAHSMGCVP